MPGLASRHATEGERFMTHIQIISKGQEPARAESLLVWQQKAAIFGVLATGLNTLFTAANTYTHFADWKNPPA